MNMAGLGDLKEKIIGLYTQNHRVGVFNGKKYDYTCPSPGWYPHQYLWDTCFHAIVLSKINTNRSFGEIETLLSSQRKNGFIPCVTIWKRRFLFEDLLYASNITQPPLIPLAVEIIYKNTKNKKFVSDAYPKLVKFIDWFFRKRDLNKNGLIEINHPWEDGDDGNPSFDKQMGFGSNPSTPRYFWSLFTKLFGIDTRRFRAETVLFNSIFARSLLSMSKLAKILGKKNDILLYEKAYEKVKLALIKNCWDVDGQIFYDLDNKGNMSKIKSISCLMALILPDLPAKIYKPLIEKHLLDTKEFWTPVPLASVARSEKTFNPGKSFVLWRGPMWINTNWLLSKALIHYSYNSQAQVLIRKTKETVDKHGFWEFYDSVTGEGYGQKDLAWSGLVLDMISWKVDGL